MKERQIDIARILIILAFIVFLPMIGFINERVLRFLFWVFSATVGRFWELQECLFFPPCS